MTLTNGEIQVESKEKTQKKKKQLKKYIFKCSYMLDTQSQSHLAKVVQKNIQEF